jgi:hypothetical protein
MRELIKQILKEETSPDEIKKGIDIAVKVLKKEYPFIVGWEYSDPLDRWAYKIYINLEVDHSKMMEFYGLKPHPRFYKFLKDDIETREKHSYPFSQTNYEEDENFDTDEYRILQRDLFDFYQEMIPSKLKMNRGSNAVFNQDDPKDLSVDNYIFVK